MANELKTTIRDCIHNIDANKRYVRPEEVADYFGLQIEDILVVALAAGAVYKLGDAQGGTVLINLELFDEYMEQFHEPAVEMKHPLWKATEKGE